MAITIDACFDGGNIDILAQPDPASFDLAIRPDHNSAFYQWFFFRIGGAQGQPLTLRLTNAGGAAYPAGWTDYRACISADRTTWQRTPTHYENGVLTITLQPQAPLVWVSYFAPYSLERHADLLARLNTRPGVAISSLGLTLDGRSLDLVSLASDPQHAAARKAIWLIGRQHPGETMAAWWMEGMLEQLTNPDDAVARALRRQFDFYIVPNMNPDGSYRGHLRTNAAGVNLNREWSAPSLSRSPEVFHVLARMHETGVALCLDVHGDEALPHNFIAGCEGIPGFSARQADLLARYVQALAARSPDFQTVHGYPKTAPGKANMSLCTNAVAQAFGALAMTLEMPFKDAAEMPDAVQGWSPERSKGLGRACLDALLQIAQDL